MATSEKTGVLGKQELTERVRDRCPGELVSKAAASNVIDAVLDTIIDAILEERQVAIPGLGKFRITERAARDGRNPLTGEPMKIKASKGVGFRAASTLKKSLNDSKRRR